MRNETKLLVAVGLVLLGGLAFASFIGDMSRFGLEQSGSDIRVNMNFHPKNAIIETIDTISLTSPTNEIPVAGISNIEVTMNVSQTSCSITGGALGQVARIIGTSDSVTIGLTDGTSGVSTLALTGNLTLGVNDSVLLQCVSAGGATWRQVGALVNN